MTSNSYLAANFLNSWELNGLQSILVIPSAVLVSSLSRSNLISSQPRRGSLYHQVWKHLCQSFAKVDQQPHERWEAPLACLVWPIRWTDVVLRNVIQLGRSSFLANTRFLLLVGAGSLQLLFSLCAHAQGDDTVLTFEDHPALKAHLWLGNTGGDM